MIFARHVARREGEKFIQNLIGKSEVEIISETWTQRERYY